MKNENEVLRRAKMWLWSCAEILIGQAMQEVERMGADERLTKAVTLLADAKNAVADFVDNVNLQNYHPHYYKCPDCGQIVALHDKSEEWLVKEMSIGIHRHKVLEIPCRVKMVEITFEEYWSLANSNK
jgi:hypothetical protein